MGYSISRSLIEAHVFLAALGAAGLLYRHASLAAMDFPGTTRSGRMAIKEARGFAAR